MNHEIQSQMMVYSWENRRTSRFSIAKQGLLSRFVTHFPKWRIYRDLNRINIDLIYVGPSNSFRMINSTTSSVSHRIHGAGIYANIWGILWYIDGIHVTIYSSTMDPLGFGNVKTWDDWVLSQVCCMCCLCRHLRHLHFHRGLVGLGRLGAWEIWPPAAVNGTSRCLLVAAAWRIFSLLALLLGTWKDLNSRCGKRHHFDLISLRNHGFSTSIYVFFNHFR